MFKGTGGMMISTGLLFVAFAIAIFLKDAANSFYFVSGVVMIVGGTIMNELSNIRNLLEAKTQQEEG